MRLILLALSQGCRLLGEWADRQLAADQDRPLVDVIREAWGVR